MAPSMQVLMACSVMPLTSGLQTFQTIAKARGDPVDWPVPTWYGQSACANATPASNKDCGEGEFYCSEYSQCLLVTQVGAYGCSNFDCTTNEECLKPQITWVDGSMGVECALEEEQLPSPSPTPPCDTTSGTCTVIEDPHITVFDGPQISLLAIVGSNVRKISGGDKWLVKSGSVSIQARYMTDKSLNEENELVRAVAVGGPFLMDNIITVGSLEDHITWNGIPILTDESAESSRFDFNDGNFSVSIVRTQDSKNVANMKLKNPGIDIKLPMGVSLIVNRLRRHLNVAVTMPQQEGGQEGLCGNFNGFGSDDSLELTSKRFDPNVPSEESLFAGPTA